MTEPHLVSAGAALERVLSAKWPQYAWTVTVRPT